MAIDISKIKRVDKLRITENTYVYNFLEATMIVDTETTEITTILKSIPQNASTNKFEDLEDNFGTATALAYADYIADNTDSFFFNPETGTVTTDVNITSQSAGLALDATLQGIDAKVAPLSLEATQQQVKAVIDFIAIDKRPNRAIEGYDNANNNNTNLEYICYAVRGNAGDAFTFFSCELAGFINTNDNGRVRIRRNGTTTAPPTFINNPNGDGIDFAIGAGSLAHNTDGELIYSDFIQDRVQYSISQYDLSVSATDIIYFTFQPLSNARFYAALNYKKQ